MATNINPGTVGVTTQGLNAQFAAGAPAKRFTDDLVNVFKDVLPQATQLAQQQAEMDSAEKFRQGQIDATQRMASGDTSAPKSSQDDFYMAGNLSVYTRAQLGQTMLDGDALANKLGEDAAALKSGDALKQLDAFYHDRVKGVGALPGVDVTDLLRIQDQRQRAIEQLTAKRVKLERADKEQEIRVSLAGQLTADDPNTVDLTGLYNQGKTSVLGAQKTFETLVDEAKARAEGGDFTLYNKLKTMVDIDTGLDGLGLAAFHGKSDKLADIAKLETMQVTKNLEAREKERKAEEDARLGEYENRIAQDKLTGAAKQQGYSAAQMKSIMEDTTLSLDSKTKLLGKLPEFVEEEAHAGVMTDAVMASPTEFNKTIYSGKVDAEKAQKDLNGYIRTTMQSVDESQTMTPEQKAAAKTLVIRQGLKYDGVKLDIIDQGLKSFANGGLYDKSGKMVGAPEHAVVMSTLMGMPKQEALLYLNKYGVSESDKKLFELGHDAVNNGGLSIQAVYGNLSDIARSPSVKADLARKLNDWEKVSEELLKKDTSGTFAIGQSTSIVDVNTGIFNDVELTEEGEAGKALISAALDYGKRTGQYMLMANKFTSPEAAAAAAQAQMGQDTRMLAGKSKVGIFSPTMSTAGTRMPEKFASSAEKRVAMDMLSDGVSEWVRNTYGKERKVSLVDLSDPDQVYVQVSGMPEPLVMNRSVVKFYQTKANEKLALDGYKDAEGLTGTLKGVGDILSGLAGMSLPSAIGSVGKTPTGGGNITTQITGKGATADAARNAIAWYNKPESVRAKEQAQVFVNNLQKAQQNPQTMAELFKQFPGLKQSAQPLSKPELEAAKELKPVQAPASVKSMSTLAASYGRSSLLPLIAHEGISTVAYNDVGYPAIGMGYNLGKQSEAQIVKDFAAAGIPTDPAFIKQLKAGKVSINQEQALRLTMSAVDTKYEPALLNALNKIDPNLVNKYNNEWTDGQKGAAIAAVYNTGGGNMEFMRKLVSYIDRKDIKGILNIDWTDEGKRDRSRTKQIMASAVAGINVFKAQNGIK